MKRFLFLCVCSLVLSAASPSASFDYKEVYRDRSPAVVLIVALRQGGGGASGTGSLIREDGLVLTNAHVIIDKSTGRVFPFLYIYPKPENFRGDSRSRLPKRRFRAVPLKLSEDLDLALVRIESPPGKMPVIPLADPSSVEIGDPVLAIGHPEQGGLWTLTTGVISAKIRDFEGILGKDVFQTETSFNRGNSGGPLLNLDGAMVGVNSNIARKGKGDLAITGVNFSISSGVAKKWMDETGYAMAYARPPEKAPVPTEKKETVDLNLDKYPPIPKEPEAEPEPALPPRERKERWAEGTRLTPERPYMPKDLFRVEGEMKDLMERMRKKF